MSDWQPIETAPKDRKVALFVDGIVIDGCWQADHWETVLSGYIDGADNFVREPTALRLGNPTLWSEL